jgi:iron complex transport system ATP-binding protein
MILAENISLKRGSKTLFAPASFRFDQPELVAIIGPNGAGKSTLLQLLSGFYAPSTGSVLIHEKPAESWKPDELAKYRAYLQQQQSVFESFTVEDVLMIGRSIHFNSHPKQADADLVTQTLANLELSERRSQPFNQLSGGEQQRVQFARTLLQLQETGNDSLEGKVLFLDEPLNNLDIYYQYNLLQMARSSVVDRGGIIIAVLHDLNMACQFADRVIVLSEGKTIIDAPTDEALVPGLLSAIFHMNIEKIQPPNQLPYFAVTSMPATAATLNANRMTARH